MASITEWYGLTGVLKHRIESHLINRESSVRHSTFITKRRLLSVWTDELFAKLKTLLQGHNVRRTDFFAHSVFLVSALIKYDWVPQFGTDTLQVNGLYSSALNMRLTDDDLPMSPQNIRKLLAYNVGDFRDGQYAFKPAIIDDQGEGFCWFSEGTRLPFEYEHHWPHDRKSGWYGDVSKVRIKKGHIQKPGFDFDKPVACKFIRHSRENFEQELKNLELIGQNAIKSEHIVTHIVAIVTPPNHFHIVFPWAWTDLASFFQLSPLEYPPWLDRQLVTPQTLFAEVGYVAQALDFLHNNIYTNQQRVSLYHMDLKPDNILIFEPMSSRERNQAHPLGLWKITDFGVSDSEKVRGIGDLINPTNLYSTSPSRPLPLTRQSGPYQAPEVERFHEVRHCTIDHARADVWSYGTVVTEVLAFAIENINGVRTLKELLARTDSDGNSHYRSGYFFHASAQGEYMLHPSLIDWFEHYERPFLWYDELWECIKNNALCVDPSRRSPAAEFHRHLLAQSERLRELILSSIFNDNYSDDIVENDPVAAGGILEVATARQSDARSVSQTSMSSSWSRSLMTPNQSGRDPGFINSRTSSVRVAGPRIEAPLRVAGTIGSADTTSPHDSTRSSSVNAVDIRSVFITSVSWTDSTICQEVRQSFPEHLIGEHLSGRRPKFVALSQCGSKAIFSDGKRLCCAHVTTANNIICAGDFERMGQGEISLESIKFANTFVAVHDTNEQIALQPMNRSTAMLAFPSERGLGIRRSIVRFNVAPTGYIGIEYSKSIESFTPDGQRCLQYSKPFDENLVALAFDELGNTLFAATRNKYLVWRSDARTGSFLQEVELRHDLISAAQTLRPVLIPIGQDFECLLQNKENPCQAYFLSPSTNNSLNADGPKYYTSGQLLPINSGTSSLCFGHRKRTIGWSTDILLKLDLRRSAGGRRELVLSEYFELPKELQSTSIETAIRILYNDRITARVIKPTGHMHDVDLGPRPQS